MQEKDGCLPSQGIRDMIRSGKLKTEFKDLSLRQVRSGTQKRGWFSDETLEDKIQPASFDTSLGGEAFVVPTTENLGLPGPSVGESFYRSLLRLPKWRRQEKGLDGGLVLVPGHTYFIPLENRVITQQGMRVSAWPKSSIGRNFLDIQLYSDFNPSVDSIDFEDHPEGRELRSHREGYEPVNGKQEERLIEIVRNAFFHQRYDCENDERLLQPVPYVIVFGEEGTVFSYVRAENVEDYGDERLFGKHSIGVGGHIHESDGPDYVLGCIEREVFVEEVEFCGKTGPKLLGTLLCSDKPVDRVHFGLVYGMHTSDDVTAKDPALATGRMMQIDDILGDTQMEQKYETWSAILIPHLKGMYLRGG
ncbi:MAG: 2'-deoxycytidine 5'-triphosphate deaminase domain-containing protein [Candidatus Nanoarchaeia archaeon]